MSGIELQRQLKASHSTVPVIFMTALDDDAIRRQAVESGGIDCLRKPFPARQLFDAIEKAGHFKGWPFVWSPGDKLLLHAI